MPLYMVSYDIPEENPGYSVLVKYLEGLGATKVLQSQWLIDHDGDAEAVLKRLTNISDEGDRLVVHRIDTHDTAWNNVIPTDDEMQILLFQ